MIAITKFPTNESPLLMHSSVLSANFSIDQNGSCHWPLHDWLITWIKDPICFSGGIDAVFPPPFPLPSRPPELRPPFSLWPLDGRFTWTLTPRFMMTFYILVLSIVTMPMFVAILRRLCDDYIFIVTILRTRTFIPRNGEIDTICMGSNTSTN